MTGHRSSTPDKPGHKPSETHTLDEVLKSLQDLIRNELLDAEPKPPPPPKPHYGKVGRPRKVVEAKPPPPTKRELQAAATPPSLDQVMSTLRELVNEELTTDEPTPALDRETMEPPAADIPVPEAEPISLEEAFVADDALYTEDTETEAALVPDESEPVDLRDNMVVPPGGIQQELVLDLSVTAAEDEALAPLDAPPTAAETNDDSAEPTADIDLDNIDAPPPEEITLTAIEEPLAPSVAAPPEHESFTPRIEPLPPDLLAPLPALKDVADVLSDEPLTEPASPTDEPATAPADAFDDIPVLSDIVAPGRPPAAGAPPQQSAHALAIRVIARANIERRKRGEPQLDPKTVHQIELILEEELEKAAPKGENDAPEQP